MGCVCTSPDQYVACAALPVRFSQSDVETYAHRVGAQGGKDNWVLCYVIACLRVNRIIYWRNEPGDCGGQTGAGLGVSGVAAKGATLGRVGVGLAGSTGLVAAGTAATASVVLAPVAIVAGIFGSIFGHHSRAVKIEQDTLCDVFAAYNSFADQAEAFLKSGHWSVQDADTALDQMHDRLAAEAEPIAHPYNAAFGVVKALDALQLFNEEKVYPNRGLLGGVLGKGLAVGAGVVGAKVLGVF